MHLQAKNLSTITSLDYFSEELPTDSTSLSQHYQLSLMLAYLQLHDYQFTTVSPTTHQIVNARLENKVANNLTDIFGWNRAFKAESVDGILFGLMQTGELLIKTKDGWKSKFRVSTIFVPTQFCYPQPLNFLHSGFPTLETDAVFFGPDTYRFANAIYGFLESCSSDIKRAVDIGTGSGAGLALLAIALPEADIFGVDINQDALDFARINLEASGIHHAHYIKSNLLNHVEGQFDLIIANPPYLLDQSERAYRHGGGQLGNGLSIEIVEAAINRLNAGGTLLLYTGVAMVNGFDAFFADISVKLDFAGFTFSYHEIDPDIFGEELLTDAYAQADRIAAVVLTAHKPAI